MSFKLRAYTFKNDNKLCDEVWIWKKNEFQRKLMYIILINYHFISKVFSYT